MTHDRKGPFGEQLGSNQNRMQACIPLSDEEAQTKWQIMKTARLSVDTMIFFGRLQEGGWLKQVRKGYYRFTAKGAALRDEFLSRPENADLKASRGAKTPYPCGPDGLPEPGPPDGGNGRPRTTASAALLPALTPVVVAETSAVADAGPLGGSSSEPGGAIVTITAFSTQSEAPEVPEPTNEPPPTSDAPAVAELEARAGDSTQVQVGGGFGNPAENKEVEEAAINTVKRRYEDDGWNVRSVERSKCGFDLECTKDDCVENVEVKGVRGTEQSFLITAGEVDQAEKNPHFVLVVVTSALSTSPVVTRYTGSEFLNKFALSVVQYRAVLRG